MKTSQHLVRDHAQLIREVTAAGTGDANLVLVFGSTEKFQRAEMFPELRATFPSAILLGCTTAGEIHGVQVLDDSLVLLAIRFEKTQLRATIVRLTDARDSFDAGQRLARQLSGEGLAHVFVLSEGLKVNGTKLVEGISKGLPKGVAVTGGLSGDGSRFSRTMVMLDGPPQAEAIAAVGFYGSSLRVGYGSLGGWDSFGQDRLITKSAENVLYELDGKPALDLYKLYLGKAAEELPASALLYPLSLAATGGAERVVRTVLSVNEKDRSVTFAGDMPTGGRAQLMKANFDRLIEGAIGAAKVSLFPGKGPEAQLAILISCVGRKLVLKQRVEEEVEGVREVLGNSPALIGFYSYGEISPFTPEARCELHNQTMTITTMAEI